MYRLASYRGRQPRSISLECSRFRASETSEPYLSLLAQQLQHFYFSSSTEDERLHAKKKPVYIIQTFRGSSVKYSIRDNSEKYIRRQDLSFDDDKNGLNFKKLTVFRKANNAFKSTFLPTGYPETVGPNYSQYVLWQALSSAFLTINSVIASACLLYAVGIGSGISTSATAGALSWILKDGFGQLGTLVFGKVIAHSFDVHSKSWNFISMALLTSAACMEVSTVYFPNYFLIIGALANTIKGLALMAGSSTRSVFNLSFARDNNIADVTAKGTSQYIFSSLVGTTIGAWLSALIGQSFIAAAAVSATLAILTLFSAYRSATAVPLNTLNSRRLQLVTESFLRNVRDETRNHRNHTAGVEGRMWEKEEMLVLDEEKVYGRGSVRMNDIGFSNNYVSNGSSNVESNSRADKQCDAIGNLDHMPHPQAVSKPMISGTFSNNQIIDKNNEYQSRSSFLNTAREGSKTFSDDLIGNGNNNHNHNHSSYSKNVGADTNHIRHTTMPMNNYNVYTTYYPQMHPQFANDYYDITYGNDISTPHHEVEGSRSISSGAGDKDGFGGTAVNHEDSIKKTKTTRRKMPKASEADRCFVNPHLHYDAGYDDSIEAELPTPMQLGPLDPPLPYIYGSQNGAKIIVGSNLDSVIRGDGKLLSLILSVYRGSRFIVVPTRGDSTKDPDLDYDDLPYPDPEPGVGSSKCAVEGHGTFSKSLSGIFTEGESSESRKKRTNPSSFLDVDPATRASLLGLYGDDVNLHVIFHEDADNRDIIQAYLQTCIIHETIAASLSFPSSSPATVTASTTTATSSCASASRSVATMSAAKEVKYKGTTALLKGSLATAERLTSVFMISLRHHGWSLAKVVVEAERRRAKW